MVAVFGALAVVACRDEDGSVARLLEHQGQVDRQPAGTMWQAASDGERFACGDGLRTGPAAWARIDIRGRGRARLDRETTVRLRCAAGTTGFDVEVGEASILAEGAEFAFDLDIGRAILQPGSQLDLRSADGKTRFTVVVGSAIIEKTDGPAEKLAAGQYLDIEIGRAIIVPGKPEAVDAGVADASDAGPGDALPDAGEEPATRAVTVALSGKNHRLRRPDGKRFERLAAGSHPLEPGSVLRLARRGTAKLERDAERATVSGPSELTIGEPGDKLFAIQNGEATVQADGSPVRIAVPGGTIDAEGGDGSTSRAHVEVDRKKSRVRAQAGRTTVRGNGGGQETLDIGESAVLTHSGRLEIKDRAPARADVVIAAGESPTIHDPAPPIAVGVRFGDECDDTEGQAVLEVARRRNFAGELRVSRGKEQANVRLEPGRGHFYRVRCLGRGGPGKIVASGRIAVVRDRATRGLPRYAPKNRIDADGRPWTVLYQNLLPEITFVWPRPEGAGPYKLHLVADDGNGKDEITTTDESSYRMRSGSLAEGSYRFFFESGSARSRTSSLRIEFDNAAPSAYLRAPEVGKAWTGSELEVTGAALPGASVRVAENAVEPDGKGRFRTTVSLPISGGTLAVRTAHPKAGVHYYLRRDRAGR